MADLVAGVEITWPSDAQRIPATLRQIMRRGTRRDPAQRYPEMRSLLHVLRSASPRRRRKLVLLAGTGAVIAGLVWGLARWTGAQDAGPCARIDALLIDTWDDSRRAALSSAFVRIDPEWGADAAASMSTRLDAWAEQWHAEQARACVATYESGEQSQSELAAHVTCLDAQRARVAGIVALLVDGERELLEQSGDASWSLPDPALCRSAQAEGVLPPDSLEVAAQVNALAPELHQIELLSRTTAGVTLVERAERALASATATGYAPLVAHAELALARASGDSATARDRALDALRTALAAGDRRIAARAANSVVEACSRASEHAEARRWSILAEGLAEQLGDDEVRGVVLIDRAQIEVATGDYDEGLRLAEAAVALGRRTWDADDLHWTSVWYTLAMAAQAAGDLERAMTAADAAYGSSLRNVGRGHPRTVKMRSLLAAIHLRRDEFGAAIPVLREIADAPVHAERDVGVRVNAKSNLAYALLSTGDAAAAAGLFESVEADGIARGRPLKEVAEAAANRATAELAMGELERAADSAARASSMLEAATPDSPLAGVALEIEAEVALARGKPAFARERLERALARMVAAWGPEHEQTIEAEAALALAEARDGAVAAAITRVERIVPLLDRIATRRNRARALAHLILAIERDRPALAEELRRRHETLAAELGDAGPPLRRHLERLGRAPARTEPATRSVE